MTEASESLPLIERVKQVIETEKLSQGQVSKEAGIEANGSSKFNQWLQGKYKGDNESIEAQLEKWLEQRRTLSEAVGEMPDAPGWLPTPTAVGIVDTLRYAQMAKVMVSIHGGAGLGKTVTCKAFAKKYPNVFIVAVNPTVAEYGACLRRIASALGIRSPKTAKDALQEQIIERLEGTNGLLIFDEAQILSNDALWGIKSIFDEAEIGVAYVGSNQLPSNLTGRRSEMNAPVSSRISKRKELKQAKREDVTALLEGWKIATDGNEGKKMLDFCIKIASKPGALRTMTETLRLASMLAVGAEAMLSMEMVKQAYQSLGGE